MEFLFSSHARSFPARSVPYLPGYVHVLRLHAGRSATTNCCRCLAMSRENSRPARNSRFPPPSPRTCGTTPPSHVLARKRGPPRRRRQGVNVHYSSSLQEWMDSDSGRPVPESPLGKRSSPSSTRKAQLNNHEAPHLFGALRLLHCNECSSSQFDQPWHKVIRFRHWRAIPHSWPLASTIERSRSSCRLGNLARTPFSLILALAATTHYQIKRVHRRRVDDARTLVTDRGGLRLSIPQCG